MTQLATVPASFEMASTETLPLAVDFSGYLGAATIASVTSVVLTNLATQAAYTAGIGTRTNTTTTVTQTVTAIASGTRYRLAITITDSAGRIWTSETTLVGVF